MSVGGSLDQQWARVSGRLKDEVGETAYRSWLKPLTIGELKGGEISITVPTRFMRDWVLTHYADRIRALWSGENPRVQSVDIVVAPSRVEVGASGQRRHRSGRAIRCRRTRSRRSAPSPAPSLGWTAATSISPISIRASPSRTSSSASRTSSPMRPPGASPTPATVPFNPLFLYGGVGLGKTHLMHAIAWHIRKQRPRSAGCIYLSAEKFMYQFIRALRFKDTMAFKEQFRSVDVLMIDDVQFISGKDCTQEEFFHTFNALVDQNRQIVHLRRQVARPTSKGMEERLRSRLGWGLVADIHPTTYELRLGILQAKAEQMKVADPAKVLEFLAHKITSNVRELEGALNRIVAHADAGRPRRSRWRRPRRCCTTCCAPTTAGSRSRRSRSRWPSTTTSGWPTCIRPAAPARSPGRARWRCTSPSSSPPARCRRSAASSAAATTPRSCTRSSKVEELRASDQSFAEDVELLRRMLEG